MIILNRKFNNYLKSNTFTMLSGSVLSQFIPLLIYPLLTRIYEPENFGVLSLVNNIAALLTIISTGSYENTILIEDDDKNIYLLNSLIFRRCFLIFIFSSICLLFLNLFPRFSSITFLLIFAPLIAYMNASILLSSENLIKNYNYFKLASNRIFLALSLSISKLIFGILGSIQIGLVIGELISRFLLSIVFFKSAKIKFKFKLNKDQFINLKKLKKRYNHFEKYTVLDQLINTLGGSIHVFMISIAFGNEALGYVSILLSIMYLPVTVIANALQDIFRPKFKLFLDKNGNCQELYLTYLFYVSLVGLIIFATIFFTSDYIFPLALGAKWSGLANYAKILVPMFFFNLVSMSMGGIMLIKEKTKSSLTWQALNLIFTFIALFVGCFIMKNLTGTLILYSSVKSTFYIIYILLSYYYSKPQNKLGI